MVHVARREGGIPRRSMAARNAVKTPGETARGAGYPPNEVSRRRRSLEGREAEVRRSATNSTRGATRGFVLGRQPGGTFESETITSGLAPDGVYVYAEWGEGRANRPPCTGSTVAPTVTARWKASQHGRGFGIIGA